MKRLVRWVSITFAVLVVLIAVAAAIRRPQHGGDAVRGLRRHGRRRPGEDHLSFLNEGEVKALYAYLHGLAAARK